MALSLNTQYARYIAITVPILSAITAYFLVVPRYQALKADEQALAEAQAAIAQTTASVAVLKNAPKGPPYAHVPNTKTEPVEFYQHLYQVAHACGVTLAHYNFVPAPPEPVAQASPPPPPIPGMPQENNIKPPTSPQPGQLPPGISPKSVSLGVEGPYANMALFFGQLESYPRLVSIKNVKMAASKYPAITADFTLTRYVSEVPPPTDAAQPQ
jgi:hypothetical protein